MKPDLIMNKTISTEVPAACGRLAGAFVGYRRVDQRRRCEAVPGWRRGKLTELRAIESTCH